MRSPIADLVIRVADLSDVHAIAEAHRDSIRSIGPAFYPPDAVAAWERGVRAGLYLDAMNSGEVFFVATGSLDGPVRVLGFSSDYPLDGTIHGMSVYVSGVAARRGVGTALLRTAAAHAARCGATRIAIEASLAGVCFYRANGFVEVGRGETRLTSGHPIACVFMQKPLAPQP